MFDRFEKHPVLWPKNPQNIFLFLQINDSNGLKQNGCQQKMDVNGVCTIENAVNTF